MTYTNFVKTFLKLTNWTVPFGTEKWYVDHILEPILGFKLKFDGMNYYHTIGDSKTMFCCHLDTASSTIKKVKHGFMDNIIFANGDTILGADDKAGLMVILMLIEAKIPGRYYFFSGEECGRVGSTYAKTNYRDVFEKFDRAIAWDRRDKASVITHQMMERCCSKQFTEALCDKFKAHGLWFDGDSNGIYTDTATFMGVIPECTNLSIGYHGEHTPNEYIDILYAYHVGKASVKIDWDMLPVFEFEPETSWGSSWGCSGNTGSRREDDYRHTRYFSRKKDAPKPQRSSVFDTEQYSGKRIFDFLKPNARREIELQPIYDDAPTYP